jgi:hypothetical protein
MSPLFQKGEEKAAREAAAFAELERMRALAPDELALEVLPALGPDGPRGSRFVRVQDICKWLMRSHRVGLKASPMQLLAVVREALQRLEHADLVWSMQSDGPSLWKLTRLGEQALSGGTAAQHLGPLGASARSAQA